MYPRLSLAILRATQWHDGQWRDGENALPYITHPIDVLVALREVGGVVDEDLLCTAVLHDVLEETSATAGQIRELFGERVCSLVVHLTRHEPSGQELVGLSKDEIWQKRADLLLSEIAAMPAEVLPVKLADRYSNVRQAIRTKSPKKAGRYVWQTKRILEIVPRTSNPGLWDAISEVVALAKVKVYVPAPVPSVG